MPDLCYSCCQLKCQRKYALGQSKYFRKWMDGWMDDDLEFLFAALPLHSVILVHVSIPSSTTASTLTAHRCQLPILGPPAPHVRRLSRPRPLSRFVTCHGSWLSHTLVRSSLISQSSRRYSNTFSSCWMCVCKGGRGVCGVSMWAGSGLLFNLLLPPHRRALSF